MKIKSLQFWYITVSLCILRLTKSSTEKRILPSQSVSMMKQSKHAHECQKTIIWKQVQVSIYFFSFKKNLQGNKYYMLVAETKIT